jgi:hypothetical protein
MSHQTSHLGVLVIRADPEGNEFCVLRQRRQWLAASIPNTCLACRLSRVHTRPRGRSLVGMVLAWVRSGRLAITRRGMTRLRARQRAERAGRVKSQSPAEGLTHKIRRRPSSAAMHGQALWLSWYPQTGGGAHGAQIDRLPGELR